MKFAIQVLEGPYNHEAADSAYNFATAALEKGHEIVGVFFYHDGVINVSNQADPPQDDRNVQQRWSELGKKGVDIVACIAASKRRGIKDGSIVEGTRISGLGQLTDMTIEADRLVTFG
ncbi:MAG: sulfurtransferase complex subunit TusD [Candidatus Nitrospinota bacterium M3_3B_026]